MKVLLVNGSPNAKGCTYTALNEVARALTDEGVEAEMFQLGVEPLTGCVACGGCAGKGLCAFDDRVNDFLRLCGDADGFVFGSPVHYASAGGAITSFLDRAFFASMRGGKKPFYLKPAACVVSARRAGTTAALDQLNKYLMISEMLVVSSKYWNMVHGMTPEEVARDLEGLQVMRVLGRNMAWTLKCIKAARAAGIAYPKAEPRVSTNFIR